MINVVLIPVSLVKWYWYGMVLDGIRMVSLTVSRMGWDIPWVPRLIDGGSMVNA